MSPDNMIPDTGDPCEPWCPTCEPGRDPSRELLRVRWCFQHEQKFPGADDAKAGPSGPMLPGSGDGVGSWGNRAMCDLIHRGRGGDGDGAAGR